MDKSTCFGFEVGLKNIAVDLKDVDVSKNGMVYNGKVEKPIKIDDLGVPSFLETPTSKFGQIKKHLT